MIHVIRFMRTFCFVLFFFSSFIQWFLMTYENDQIIGVLYVGGSVLNVYFALFILCFWFRNQQELCSSVHILHFVNYNSNKRFYNVYHVDQFENSIRPEWWSYAADGNMTISVIRRLTLIIINVNIVEIDLMMNAAKMRICKNKPILIWLFVFAFWRIQMVDKFDWNMIEIDNWPTNSKWHRKTNDDYNITKWKKKQKNSNPKLITSDTTTNKKNNKTKHNTCTG